MSKSKVSRPKVSRLPPLDPLQRYTLAEACQYLRISRSRFYTKLNANEIAIIKDGGRVLVAGAEIAAQSRPARRLSDCTQPDQAAG